MLFVDTSYTEIQHGSLRPHLVSEALKVGQACSNLITFIMVEWVGWYILAYVYVETSKSTEVDSPSPTADVANSRSGSRRL